MTVSPTQIDGAEMPKCIWLMSYRHSGDVCWSSDPNPEDADELETVEYVRADIAMEKAREPLGDDVERGELIALLQRRKNQDFDGCCHLTTEEADQIIAALSVGSGDGDQLRKDMMRIENRLLAAHGTKHPAMLVEILKDIEAIVRPHAYPRTILTGGEVSR